MRKLLIIFGCLLFALPLCAQGAYSGVAQYAGAFTAFYSPTCAPPSYACLSTSTAAIPLTTPSWGTNTCDFSSPYTAQNCGNLYGAGTVRTPSDFGRKIARCTDPNSFSVGPSFYWLVADNGEPNLFAPDDSWIILKKSGQAHYLFAFNPSTMFCTPSGIAFGGIDVIADHSSNSTVYSSGLGTYKTQLSSYALPVPLTGCMPSCTTPSAVLSYDWMNSNCLMNPYNGSNGVAWTPGWAGLLTDSQDDSTFTLAIASSTDGAYGSFVASWKKSYGSSGGCDLYNTRIGTVWKHDGSCTSGSPCPIDLLNPDSTIQTFTIHETFSALNDNWNLSSHNSCLGTTNCEGGWFYWQIGTQHVVRCGTFYLGGPYCSGHSADGYTGMFQGALANLHLYSSPTTITGPFQPIQYGDTHASLNYDNATDTYPILMASTSTTSSNAGNNFNPFGGNTPPSPYYDEIYLIRTDITPPATVVQRPFHHFSTGWSTQFEPQNAIVVESSSGRFAAWPSDGMGQFGSTSGASSCHLGGPDWNNNDSADFTATVGATLGAYGPWNLITPISNNGPGYIYQVQSCSSTPCATGSREPNWHTAAPNSGNTVTEGNVTWVNTGIVADCRVEVLVGATAN
jgi:hypothetical protein